MNTIDLIDGLPGESLVRAGLSDLEASRCTVAACLVAIGHSRLREAGLLPAFTFAEIREPERRLYQLLRHESGDAYARYNSLLRELVSFENALDYRLRKFAAADPSA